MKTKFQVLPSAITLTAGVALLLAALALPGRLAAQEQQEPASSFKTLYLFTGGADGGIPKEDFLIRDNKGNLYGTTTVGGTSNFRVVFKLNPTTGKETSLYSFAGDPDGENPYSGLVRDAAGNFYGTTCCGAVGAGIVFKLDATGTETPFYTFTGGLGGGSSYAGLIRDAAGNFYGTATGGGADGVGVVFKIDPTGEETPIYTFTGGTDGSVPGAAVVHDNAGNLYGTTVYGGSGGCFDGCGVVFKLTPAGVETPLYSFTGGSDGASPYAGLIRDSAGNLYGTTLYGGLGYGVVFKLTSAGKETVLYAFTGGNDGANPYATLVRDGAGNLYGTTNNGGSFGTGVVFKLDRTNQETVLYTFTGGADGGYPRGQLLQDSAGHLYGTTEVGGFAGCGGLGCGVVFEVVP